MVGNDRGAAVRAQRLGSRVEVVEFILNRGEEFPEAAVLAEDVRAGHAIVPKRRTRQLFGQLDEPHFRFAIGNGDGLEFFQSRFQIVLRECRGQLVARGRRIRTVGMDVAHISGDILTVECADL